MVFQFSVASMDSFLSTPSARRATPQAANVNPITGISIHALREEGDLQRKSARDEKDEFLSTPSARRATISHRVPGWA